MEQGYVQVYTGDGKGKTTAAIGLAVRALGAGFRVYIAQFAKGMHYSELDALRTFGDKVEVHQCGRDCFIRREPAEEDRSMARAGLEEARVALVSGAFDLVVLDEANIAVHFGLFSIDQLLELLDLRPAGVELVITGRRAHPRLLERADLVTEMREIRHYYAAGVQARTGIEC